jgi:hypothetical protein
MPSSEKASEVSLYLHYVLQEMPFGLVPEFSEEVTPLMSIPILDLTEQQADALIADFVGQHKRFFDRESLHDSEAAIATKEAN